MHWRRSVLAVALVAVVPLTACNSGSSKRSGSSGPSSSTTRPRHHRRATTTASAPTTTSSAVGSGSSTTAPATPDSTAAPSNPGECGARANPIFAAIQGGDLGPVPLAQYTLADCRIASSTPIWSAVTLAPKPGSGVVQLTVVLERIGSIWIVQAYGQSHVSCDAPQPVPIELRLGC